jgi:hypothetical protein
MNRDGALLLSTRGYTASPSGLMPYVDLDEVILFAIATPEFRGSILKKT